MQGCYCYLGQIVELNHGDGALLLTTQWSEKLVQISIGSTLKGGQYFKGEGVCSLFVCFYSDVFFLPTKDTYKHYIL